ncbi:hypothetical protein BV20DRAFT_1111162 [Pilatotrama ljubarskyi]|nr:hypothetical protein BV20DRAFT_1111162 [Pilatotrama ljubarskyi]
MFPRGPRFPSAKAPEVPGPGAYNAQDPEWDAYKRGAFLEKTNRFNKDKPSEVPGPGAYEADPANTQNKAPSTKPSTSADRLLVLQRKLEDLERIHVEEKKSHHLEQERLKLELNRAQRTATEQTERADKLKKQNDALDTRVQELKKSTAAEQAELRELRVKLRTSEHERTQLASKHNDAGEARKALQAAEARRKDELRERDRKIAELEKSLSAERKKREAAEARWQEVKGKTDDRVQEARAAAQDLEAKLHDSQKEADVARQALQALQSRAEDTEEELLEQLEQHRAALARVVAEYGRLASTTIALSAHQSVKQEVAILQLRANRLERKLANSEGQVVELANLIRQVKDENAFLSAQLGETRSEVETYRQALRDELLSSGARDLCEGLHQELTVISREHLALETDTRNAVQADVDLWGTFDRLQRDSLLFNASVLNKELDNLHAQLTQRSAELSAAQATQTQLSESLQRAQTECAEAQRMLAENTASLAEAKAHEESLKKRLEAVHAESRAEVARVEQSLQREKEANQRLSAAVQKAKQAEQFLRSEVEQLSADLAEAEKYQEAYDSLLAEVDALVLRNALAEEEAQRLSKCNAEILGHHNPAQRIMYVDRIRRELHETKQKLLMSTRDREAVLADNDELRHELELYKSVAVPNEVKPRTAMTRVGRIPGPAALAESELGLSVAGSGGRASEQGYGLPRSTSVSPGLGARLASVPELDGSGLGDEMTLDEIM